MAKRKSNLRWKSIYPKDAEYTDTVWLAELFQELAPRHPDLTIERFARDHGVESHLISRFIDEEQEHKRLLLWHGTTEDRAEAIMKEGFKSAGNIWFTRDANFARSHAIGRSRQRSAAPVVFRCDINLRKYAHFSKNGPHYSFSHSHISHNVIRKVFRLETATAEDEGKLVDAVITRASGKPGILRWINQYLSVINEKAVDAEHPIVEAIAKWIETQYAAGRKKPISDEEMLSQISKMSIQQAAKHFGVGSQVIHQWISSGRLRAKSVRGHLVVPLQVQNIQNKRYRNIVTLWHGTTEDKAKAIVKEGFKAGRGKIWFTNNPAFARRHALGRSGRRNANPVVISCEIDLAEYPFFGRPDKKTYVFHSFTDTKVIGKEVVRDISVVKDKFSSRDKKNKPKSVDIIVTKTAGKLGVLCWINCYLELNGEEPINEEYPAVEAIFKWVEAEYAAGRDEPISNEEMMAQVMTHLKR